MSQRRGITTDRLSNVIQVLQLGRKSGVLVVERGEGAAFERGSIIFARGQIVQASAGQRQGREAMSWLNGWGACRFSFELAQPEGSQATGASPALSRITSGELPAFPATPETLPGQNNGSTGFASPSAPSRIQQVDNAMERLNQARVSRLHRHLFLLIDGHRSIPELARLMGRNPVEIKRLLHDLVYIGVIRT